MGRNRLALACVLGLTLSLAPLLGQVDKPGLKTVSYAELGQRVRGMRGKVVVVYFWADY